MNILRHATNFRSFLNQNREIKVSDLTKENYGQQIIDNPVIRDFDGDGVLTIKDYRIVMNWIQQGSPDNVALYNKQRDLAPEAINIPLETSNPTSDITDHQDEVETYAEYSSDWNDDGDVEELDRDILASFLLQGKESAVDDYNLNRMSYPKATKLPNLITANYTCPDGNCCDDDYDEDGVLSSKDALIHYAFTSLIDWENQPPDVNEVDYYNSVAPEGFRFEPKHLPTMSCGDFEENGKVNSADSLIYYAWSSLTEWLARTPDKRVVDYFYENALDGFKFRPQHSPVCPEDAENCIGTEELCFGEDDSVDWQDYLIFYKWLIEGKCKTIDCYNCVREEYPEACRLPVDMYHNVGANKVTFDEAYSGEENL
jgi:hypothetical protein